MVAAKMVFVRFFWGEAQIWGLPRGYVHDLLESGKKVKAHIALPGNPRATGCHLPYGITQLAYLPPDTSERAPPNPRYAGWYSIYLSQRDGMEG